jgi:D-xylose reductase
MDSKTIPKIGLGTYNMGNTEHTCEVIYNSIKDGTRLIDTAAVYGTETGIGLGIKKAISENIVKREDLFIITKCGKHARENPEEAIKGSLKALQLDYVDLYLDHWPLFLRINEKGENFQLVPLHIFWPKFESLVEKGYTKYIGVSNYNVQTLINLLSFCKIKPFANEVEFHPYLYQKNLLFFCKKENIKILAYNPLCKGNYDYHSNEEKIEYDLLNHPIIKEISEKYKKTPGQIVLNWEIQKNVIPIPATSKSTRMKENLGSTEFNIEKEDIEKIYSLNKNYRFGSSLTWNILDKYDIFA